MNLIIFDIDGTLTKTTAIDSQCFIEAVQEQLQIRHFNTNWHDYCYSTDSGITQEIYAAIYARCPSNEEVNALRLSFVGKLENAHQKNREWFAPQPGATSLFARIKALGEWHIGIATGTWRHAAAFKLKAAEIGLYHEVPLSSADDHIERFELIQRTIQLAKEQYGVDNYQRLIYVGDKSWDFYAAQQLKMEFIGVGVSGEESIRPHLQLDHYDGKHAHAFFAYLIGDKPSSVSTADAVSVKDFA